MTQRVRGLWHDSQCLRASLSRIEPHSCRRRFRRQKWRDIEHQFGDSRDAVSSNESPITVSITGRP